MFDENGNTTITKAPDFCYIYRIAKNVLIINLYQVIQCSKKGFLQPNSSDLTCN